MIQWLFAFGFTQVIEAPIWMRAFDAERPLHWRVAAALLPSTLTHPIVWFGFPVLFTSSWGAMFVAAETFAVLAEIAIARALGLSLSQAAAFSLVANGVSASVGLVSQTLFGFP